MAENQSTRRTFLEAAGIAGGLCALGGSGPQPAQGAAAAMTCDKIYTRRDVKTLDPNGTAIASLGRGIQVMQGRRFDDPTSWIYQAAIHGNATAYRYWNMCQHGNWWFFPWHRMYLYFFELILRDASGDPELTLPYWHWDDPNDPSQRAIPRVFRVPNDASNGLYDGSRDANMNSPSRPWVLTDYYPGWALAVPDFIQQFSPRFRQGFGGRALGELANPQQGHDYAAHGALEGSAWGYGPHDQIHSKVGGPGGDMTYPSRAAVDPLFWSHHANIDRLWKVWHRQDPVHHLDPDNPTWLSQSFTFFKPDKTRVTMTPADVLDTVRDLCYRYDDDPADELDAAPPPRARTTARRETPMPDHADIRALLGPALAATPAGKKPLGPGPTKVVLPLNDQAGKQINALTGYGDKPPRAAFLTIEEIAFEIDPGGAYLVFLGLPGASAETCRDDVHFAGSFSFFGLHGHPHTPEGGPDAPPPDPAKGAKAAQAGGGTITIDVSRTIRALKGLDLWDENALTVVILRGGAAPPDGHRDAKADANLPEVTFGRVALHLSKE